MFVAIAGQMAKHVDVDGSIKNWKAGLDRK
jgi:hypothetical protein